MYMCFNFIGRKIKTRKERQFIYKNLTDVVFNKRIVALVFNLKGGKYRNDMRMSSMSSRPKILHER